MTLRRVPVTHVAVAKHYVLNIECVWALKIQHKKRMRSVTLSSVACLLLPYFPTLSQKWYDVRENVTEHKTCVLIFVQLCLQ